LEVVMLIRITILNRFNRIEVFNHLRGDRKLKDRFGNQVSEEVRWCTTARPCTASWSGSTGTMIRMRTK
jgi:hypothetical protein